MGIFNTICNFDLGEVIIPNRLGPARIVYGSDVKRQSRAFLEVNLCSPGKPELGVTQINFKNTQLKTLKLNFK
jgi:hypothetical protein